ncbi:MAG: SDR family oxidoreductase [Gallionellaceae bacterium]
MNRILIIGCGDIALRAALLLRGRYRLFGLVRNPARHQALRAAGIIPVPGNLDDAWSLHRLARLARVVLHFAPPGNAGLKDLRTGNLLASLSRGLPPRRLIYISTSGVYGDCGGDQVSETHALDPQTPRARRRADAENQIRQWAKRNKVHASILRVPGIYAADRLPLDRLRAGTPAMVAGEDSYTNHIHADDLAAIVVKALHYARPNRIYNANDDSELKMGEYFDAVADAYGLPHPPRLPRAEVERTVSPELWSFMNESRRLTNRRMKQELKVALRYPTVDNALTETKRSGPANLEPCKI